MLICYKPMGKNDKERGDNVAEKNVKELDFERKHEEDLQRLRGFRLLDDDFMSKVFEDKECTKFLLQIILNRTDLKVITVHGQHDIKNLQGRSVRLDILAVDVEGRVYNIEIQRSDKGAEVKRARYNSSLIDANVTEPGEKYENLSLDYADCQEKIVMRLISFEKNKKMLEETPYIPFLDMAVVFYFLADNDQNGIASIRITNEIMNDWKTDVKELYTLASDNSKRIFEEKVMPMSKMFEEFNIDISKIRSEEANRIYEERSEPYVVTNNIGINGASVILYPDMLREIAAKLGGDFYVLPSSIHEVLVVSASEDIDEKSLKKMVEDINRNYLLPDEYLSDNVYKYNLIYNSLYIK